MSRARFSTVVERWKLELIINVIAISTHCRCVCSKGGPGMTECNRVTVLLNFMPMRTLEWYMGFFHAL